VVAGLALPVLVASRVWGPRLAGSGLSERTNKTLVEIQPAKLTRLVFYLGPDFDLRRTDPRHQVHPISWDLLASNTPVDVPVRAGRDDMRLEAEFDRPVKWHLLWQDSAGKWSHLLSSDGPQSIAVWPAPLREGEEPQTPTISPQDPEGLHVLFLIFGDLSAEQVDQLLRKPPVTEGPPLTLANRAGTDQMGPRSVRGAAPIPTGQEYLARIKTWLPQQATVRYIPILGKKE
jgi:hypothetical protein